MTNLLPDKRQPGHDQCDASDQWLCAWLWRKTLFEVMSIEEE
jgi:hypothetical protein